MSNPQNAILTKARTMYSHCVTQNQYRDMMKKSSVTEVAIYLRDNTIYGKNLQGVNLSEIHREQLLEILRNAKYETFEKLSAFSFSKNSDGFYSYIYKLDEANAVLKHIRYVCSGSKEMYSFSYNEILQKHTSFEYEKLLLTKTYDEVTEFLHGTGYEAVLIKNRRQNPEEIDTLKIETELLHLIYVKLYAAINKEFSKAEAAALLDMFNELNDMQSVVKAYRLKRFFNSEPDYIKEMCIAKGKRARKLIKEIANVNDRDKLNDVVSEWAPIKRFPIKDDFIEDSVMRSKSKLCNKNIHFSVYPSLTLICYMIHREIELENIVNVVEGVRYGLPESDISEMLIF